jgi:hypothetical protein
LEKEGAGGSLLELKKEKPFTRNIVYSHHAGRQKRNVMVASLRGGVGLSFFLFFHWY